MIRPTFLYPDGSFDVAFDELGHTGRVQLVNATLNPGGTYLSVPCPDGCGSVSVHPITGDGRCRALIQQVFMRQLTVQGCPDDVLAPGAPLLVVQAHMRAHCLQMGGFLAMDQPTP